MKKEKKNSGRKRKYEEYYDEEEEEELLMSKVGGRFSELPIDLFFDILSRLPLKSVSQCRWVSKTWLSLTHRPRFAELHYSREVHHRCLPSVVLSTDYKFYLLDYDIFRDLSTSTTPKEVEFKGFDDIFGSQGGKRLYEIVGCVNGLICFSSDPLMYGAVPHCPYYIVNPITGDHTVLPKSPKYKTAPVISGFGFDPHTKHYKVIRILQHDQDPSKPAEAEIFTLGSNTWREIKNIPYLTYRGAYNALVNGNLHWLSHRNLNDFEDPVIVSFDVGTEEINLIEPPPCPTRRNSSTEESLRAFEGSLCLINSYYDSDVSGPDTEMSQIWVMKDYGVQGSWVKQHVLNILGWHWFYNKMLIKLQNDEILLKLSHENDKLGYYNLTDNSFRPIKIHQTSAMQFGIPPMILFGSLFSPKNTNELKKRKRR